MLETFSINFCAQIHPQTAHSLMNNAEIALHKYSPGHHPSLPSATLKTNHLLLLPNLWLVIS